MREEEGGIAWGEGGIKGGGWEERDDKKGKDCSVSFVLVMEKML